MIQIPRKFYEADHGQSSSTPQPDKERTALTQLKDKLQVVINDLKVAKPNTELYGYRLALENVVKDIDAQLLETERKQIVEAYRDGNAGHTIITKEMFDDYFQNKYQQL